MSVACDSFGYKSEASEKKSVVYGDDGVRMVVVMDELKRSYLATLCPPCVPSVFKSVKPGRN